MGEVNHLDEFDLQLKISSVNRDSAAQADVAGGDDPNSASWSCSYDPFTGPGSCGGSGAGKLGGSHAHPCNFCP
jgi:hypothetical protein